MYSDKRALLFKGKKDMYKKLENRRISDQKIRKIPKNMLENV